jgi:hypothetical protein
MEHAVIWSINHVKPHIEMVIAGGVAREFMVGEDNNAGELNAGFCDMAAPYTVWKHFPVPDIVGFHGYRKHINFRDPEPHGWIDVSLPTFQEYKDWLRQQPVQLFNELLTGPDVLTVAPFNCSYNGGMAKDYGISRSPNDWAALECVMRMHGDFNFNTPYIRPMHFVCRVDVFNRWMKFWDKVRQELEPMVLSMDAVTPDYPKRALAFLSERIWSLWLDHSGLKVREFPLLICWDAR